MSRDDVRRTLIAYDIADDRRRDKLAKILQRYGDRVQYSVFIVDCSPARLRRLKDDALGVIATECDSVLICDLGRLGSVDDRTFSYLGRQRPITGDIVVL